jgi:hypothetical protein
VPELFLTTIKVSHGDLDCSWRSYSFVEIDSPFAS